VNFLTPEGILTFSIPKLQVSMHGACAPPRRRLFRRFSRLACGPSRAEPRCALPTSIAARLEAIT